MSHAYDEITSGEASKVVVIVCSASWPHLAVNASLRAQEKSFSSVLFFRCHSAIESATRRPIGDAEGIGRDQGATRTERDRVVLHLPLEVMQKVEMLPSESQAAPAPCQRGDEEIYATLSAAIYFGQRFDSPKVMSSNLNNQSSGVAVHLKNFEGAFCARMREAHAPSNQGLATGANSWNQSAGRKKNKHGRHRSSG